MNRQEMLAAIDAALDYLYGLANSKYNSDAIHVASDLSDVAMAIEEELDEAPMDAAMLVDSFCSKVSPA